MKNVYIIPPEAHRKLKTARSMSQTAYISAPIGFGKTELVHHYLKARRYLEISCKNGGWDPEQLNAKIEKELSKNRSSDIVLVVDDLQFLEQANCTEQLLEFVENDKIWMIFVGRAQVVKWLTQIFIEHGCVFITEQDLAFGDKEIKEYFSEQGFPLQEEQVRQVKEYSHGNPKGMQLLTRLMESYQTNTVTVELLDQAAKLYRDYLIVEITEYFDIELLEFLLQISVVDSFNLEMAEAITRNGRCGAVLALAERTGSFLVKDGEYYHIRKTLLTALREYRQETMDRLYERELYCNAGIYYETHEDLISALEMFEKSGSKEYIKKLLVRNARRNPGNGHYFKLRKYYKRLPEEEINKSAMLIAGMSMMYSLTLEPEKSEYWYDVLKLHEKEARGAEKREAKSRIAYLDISLPHRGSHNVLKIFASMPKLIFNNGMKLPEFSVTSNMPSLMNGGKDFCEWSLRDYEIAASMGSLVSRCLGVYGKGLVNIALGESLFEKGADSYAVVSKVSVGQMEAQSGGKKEMEFAALGILSRINILYGKENAALEQLNNFEQSITDEVPKQLLQNLEAFKVRIALYKGDLSKVEEWLKEAPDENQEFYILERYRYLTKVRCYIAGRNYIGALSLLEKLIQYAKSYDRKYVEMESTLLKAIVYSRTGQDYLSLLEEVLKKAHHYHFVRIISAQGSAVTKLLNAYSRWDQKQLDTNNSWFKQIVTEADSMENHYPGYLRVGIAGRADFSEQALSVLSLLAKGYSVPQMAEMLAVKSSTVKYHIKQIYKKLGVSSRSDAVLTARNVGII